MRAAAPHLLCLAALLGSSALAGPPETGGSVGGGVEHPSQSVKADDALFDLEQMKAVEKRVLSLKVNHRFARADARDRVSQLLAYWHRRFGLTSQWRGDWVRMHGTVFGIAIDGLLEVTDSCVQGFASDPGLLWRSLGISYVESKLRKYLHPTYGEP
jgi:hypothetical protein